MQTKMESKLSCPLSDEVLIATSFKWVKKLADTGGRAWALKVPVDHTNDPDIIFCELGTRLKARNKQLSHPGEQTVDAGQLFDENADCTKDLSTAWFDEAMPAMSKEKFIELYNQRTPNAVSLQSELKVTEALLNERQKLLDAIPECPTHGKCVPYALEWIDKAKNKLPDAGQLEKIIGWREFTDDNDVDAYEKEVLWKNKKTGTVFIKAYYPYDPNLPLINDYQWMPIPA